MVVMDFFNVKLGFGFSAGLFDYVLNFSLATNPLLLIPIGAFYFALYYFAFRYAITRFDLKTPGRETEEGVVATEAPVDDGAESWIRALGGAANIVALDACTTRLRLNVGGGAIDEAALRRLGARGFVRPSDNTLQVVVGPIADQLADRLRQALRGAAADPDIPAAPQPASPVVADSNPPSAPGPVASTGDVRALAAAFGGAANLAGIEVHSTRIGVTLINPEGADPRAIQASGFRGAVRVADALWHVIVGPDSGAVADQLRGVMRPAE
jgi:PTS system N-acetylglucosamine-specific IIC component